MALSNGWCTGINGMIERVQKVCSEYEDTVIYRKVDVTRREAIRQWGQPNGLFVDGKNIYKGPTLSDNKIRKAVEKQVRTF